MASITASDRSSRRLSPRLVAAGLVLLAAFATIAGAWGFELIGRYQPCALCLAERVPYYVGVPIALVAVATSFAGAGADRIARLLLVVLAGIFIWSVWLGVYHAGVEWKWWAGPPTCGVTNAAERAFGATLLDELDVHPPSCTEATWRFPNPDWGLSFAGWNAVISAAIVGIAVVGAAARPRNRGAALTRP